MADREHVTTIGQHGGPAANGKGWAPAVVRCSCGEWATGRAVGPTRRKLACPGKDNA